MTEITYYKPANINEALEMLKRLQGATLWAGGTDLVVRLEKKVLKVNQIIDLKNLNELDYIKDENPIKIGSMTTMNTIETSELIKQEFPFLAQAAHGLGSWQIRTLATIGGNIANAAPSAETAAPILVLEGTIVAQGTDGERQIKAQDFFVGPGQTTLKKDEILKEIILPKLTPDFKTVYLKQTLRRSMDIALVSVACAVKLDGNECIEARLGLGAVAPVPMRATKTETYLKGKELSETVINEAAELAVEECSPIDDIRATADYRRNLVRVLVRRALISL